MNSKYWGTITWIFFHTFAEKIKDEEFENNKALFINIIINTCNHLPCPECSEHASKVLKQAYLNNIKIKKNFVEFLRQFHNIVNIKTNKKEFTREEIKDLYNNNNLSLVLINLIRTYKSIKTSERLMMYNFYRDKFLTQLYNDIQKIKHLIDY